MAVYTNCTVLSVTYAESGNVIRVEYDNPEPPPAKQEASLTPCVDKFAEAAERAMNNSNTVEVVTDATDNRVTSIKISKP